MSKIREYAKTILGRDLTNQEVQAILAKHQALGLKETDAETGLLDTVLLEIMVLQSIPEKIKAAMDSVEQAAASKITTAAAKIVEKSSDQLVEAFRQDFAAMTWNRTVWAALIVFGVIAGSWLGGTIDVWWHDKQLTKIQNQAKELKAQIKELKDVRLALEKPLTTCGGKICVPVVSSNTQWTIIEGPYKGTPVAILNIPVIEGMARGK